MDNRQSISIFRSIRPFVVIMNTLLVLVALATVCVSSGCKHHIDCNQCVLDRIGTGPCIFIANGDKFQCIAKTNAFEHDFDYMSELVSDCEADFPYEPSAVNIPVSKMESTINSSLQISSNSQLSYTATPTIIPPLRVTTSTAINTNVDSLMETTTSSTVHVSPTTFNITGGFLRQNYTVDRIDDVEGSLAVPNSTQPPVTTSSSTSIKNPTIRVGGSTNPTYDNIKGTGSKLTSSIAESSQEKNVSIGNTTITTSNPFSVMDSIGSTTTEFTVDNSTILKHNNSYIENSIISPANNSSVGNSSIDINSNSSSVGNSTTTTTTNHIVRNPIYSTSSNSTVRNSTIATTNNRAVRDSITNATSNLSLGRSIDSIPIKKSVGSSATVTSKTFDGIAINNTTDNQAAEWSTSATSSISTITMTATNTTADTNLTKSNFPSAVTSNSTSTRSGQGSISVKIYPRDLAIQPLESIGTATPTNTTKVFKNATLELQQRYFSEAGMFNFPVPKGPFSCHSQVFKQRKRFARLEFSLCIIAKRLKAVNEIRPQRQSVKMWAAINPAQYFPSKCAYLIMYKRNCHKF